jgi:hypothetical protein
MGKCPGCEKQVGPFSIIMSWDNWGKFICPGCGSKIKFQYWLLAFVVLIGLMVAAERLLHFMLISQIPLWLSFSISFISAILIMFFVPMMWRFEKQ